jgi:CubicO group peptidase (beta-lactamase class C family)/pimeloyl-ACP methyl ester carboxylesterase
MSNAYIHLCRLSTYRWFPSYRLGRQPRLTSLSVLALLALLFASALTAGQVPDPRIAVDLEHYLTAATDLGRFSGAVLVAQNGTVVFSKAYGFADIEKRIPFRVNTQVEIASLSKMFTAMAILNLRDQGKLRLEDSVCLHLQDCPDAWKPITIDELVHHTSGIPDYEEPLDLGSQKYLAFMSKPGSSARILDDAKKLPLDFPPGSKFKYSNTGYVVLGYVIQNVSKQPFGEFIASAILRPAKLLHSGVFGFGPAPTALARGYTHGDQPWDRMLKGISLLDQNLTPIPELPLDPPHGDAGMFSTVEDLYRWSVALDDGTAAPRSDIDQVFAPGRDGYGFGWTIGTDYGEKRFQHTGVLPGYLSTIIKFPDRRITIVIVTNVDRVRMSTISAAFSAIALEKPFDMPVTGAVTKLNSDQQSALVGSYKLADGRLVAIAVDGDSISAESKGHFLAGLIPLSPTLFYMPLSDGTISFTIAENGKATQLNMHSRGEDHIGPRVTDQGTANAQSASNALPYSDHEVSVPTSDPSIVLSATLTLPNGQGPFPAVILIHGDGPHIRDQVISGSPMFAMIADYLARNRIAVIRYDKRGMGKSTGPKEIEDSTTGDLAEDTKAVLRFLKTRPEIKTDAIGLVGHSEGGMIAPMIATSTVGLRFVVLLAPPALPCREIWIKQKTDNLARLGAKPEVIPAVRAQLERLADFIASGKNDDETYYKLGHDFLAAHGVPEEKNTREFVDKLISDLRHRWYTFFLSYDPATALQKLEVPTLAVFGSADSQVPVDSNLPVFVSLLTTAKNPDFAVTVLPDQDHFFFVFDGHRLEKHNFGKMQVSPLLLRTVTEWITAHVS